MRRTFGTGNPLFIVNYYPEDDPQNTGSGLLGLWNAIPSDLGPNAVVLLIGETQTSADEPWLAQERDHGGPAGHGERGGGDVIVRRWVSG